MSDPRPSRVLRAVFRAPESIYRVGLGWVLGYRFLAVSHRGRRTGQIHETVLEVIRFDRRGMESVVVSAYGAGADRYRNIRAEPALRVRTGRLDYTPEQRFLDLEEVRAVAEEFCRDHPLEARAMPRIFEAIGAIESPDAVAPVEVMSALPMVAFRPGS
jgi:deazaflavin-dependent oxidoreductase (nitroreductase family)